MQIPNKNSEQNIFTKNLWREITAKKSLHRNLYPKSQKNNYRPNKLWRDISPKKNLKIINTKISLKRNHYQKKYERNLYERISKGTFPAKRLGKGISTKKNWRPYYQNAFEHISFKNSLKRNPRRTNFDRNLYQENIGRNMSTTNSLKRSLYKAMFERNHRKKMKKSTKSTWWDTSTKKK